MTGIVSYGAYVPYWRLQRSAIGGTLGSGGGRGTRSVASFDEDTTSLGVEAARVALRAAPDGYQPSGRLVLHHRAGLPRQDERQRHPRRPGPAVVGAHGRRHRLGALGPRRRPTPPASAAACSCCRTSAPACPGGNDEANGGDAAVAFAFGDGPDVIAEFVGGATSTGEFLDRWRLPGEPASRQWEERFGEHAYLPLVEEAVTDALKSAGIAAADLDHVVLTGTHARAVKAAAKVVGRPARGLRRRPVGLGRQHRRRPLGPGAGRRARPGRAGPDDRRRHPGRRLHASRCGAPPPPSPPTGRRRRCRSSWPPPATTSPTPRSSPGGASCAASRPAGPSPTARPVRRRSAPRRGSTASSARKDESGFVYLPPSRVSIETGSVDQMTPVRMADVQATIATFTVDRLAYSLSPAGGGGGDRLRRRGPLPVRAHRRGSRHASRSATGWK